MTIKHFYQPFTTKKVDFFCLAISEVGALCFEQCSQKGKNVTDTFLPGEMIDKLTLTYNRTRQAVITGELIEIISGAAAV